MPYRKKLHVLSIDLFFILYACIHVLAKFSEFYKLMIELNNFLLYGQSCTTMYTCITSLYYYLYGLAHRETFMLKIILAFTLC